MIIGNAALQLCDESNWSSISEFIRTDYVYSLAFTDHA